MTSTAKEAINPQFPPSVHAYCRSAAVCVTFANDRLSKPTAAIEFAEKGSGSGYAWGDKVVFQLTQGELAELCAYLHHPWQRHKWVHSKGTTAKGLSVTQQGKSVLFALSIRGRDIRVPVVPRDQYFIANLLLSRLVAIQPPLSSDDHQQSLLRLAHALSQK